MRTYYLKIREKFIPDIEAGNNSLNALDVYTEP